jgi:ubiquinone/menaquinone biosynthesis C-methylase UbiE
MIILPATEDESLSNEALSLDVGCGQNPKGDINVDLYPNVTIHRGDCSRVNMKLTPNFVRCDCLNLPFPNSRFETVICSHVIEHLDDPIHLLTELLRVSKHCVEIVCPHRYRTNAKQIGHKQFLNVAWFHNALQQIRKRHVFLYEIRTTFKPLMFAFTWPDEIRITIRKARLE